MTNIEAVGFGALNVDQIYEVERILTDGETTVSESALFPGGSAANTIYGLAKLGVTTGFIGVVGDDTEGKILVQDFQKVGVDTSQIKVKRGVETGSVLCLSDKLSRRSLYVSPGANNLLTADDLDLNYMNQRKMLHLSSFADDRQFKISVALIDRLDPSVKLSFAPGSLYAAKGIKALAPILNKTYVLFINKDEVRQLTGEVEITAGAESCLKQGCHMVAITLGKGTRVEIGGGTTRKAVTAVCYIRDPEGEYTVEPNRQNTGSEIDTTGAGDAFATGFLYGLLKRRKAEECGRLGDIAARFCINKRGARDGLPTLKELTQRCQEFYSKQL